MESKFFKARLIPKDIVGVDGFYRIELLESAEVVCDVLIANKQISFSRTRINANELPDLVKVIAKLLKEEK